MDRKDKIEIYFGGIMGVLAIISAIIEHSTGSNIFGGIKDVASTLVVVVVLCATIKFPVVGFKNKFENAMNEIKEKYNPLIIEDKIEGVIRYNIASNSNALFTKNCENPKRVFELAENEPDKISFYINKSFFDVRGGTDFDAEKITIDIENCLKSVPTFKQYEYKRIPSGSNYELRITFDHPIKSNDDINSLISLIDYTILLFVARNKS